LAKQIFKGNCYTIIIEIRIFRFAVFAHIPVGWTEIGIIRFNQATAVWALKLRVRLEKYLTANAKCCWLLIVLGQLENLMVCGLKYCTMGEKLFV